ncbi:carnitine o-octanoyltransferase [Plakobranchus ocellatus]|uniref:Peroxisomal carnitine O-octanoyltransferase n=1 Tax=Plakobranchus ocellatus TaxID=259542 RepID=A0AAV4B3F3_9GAST|nr:carnitine o-octanoyltransferase [Plakobranchus ocellatus]
MPTAVEDIILSKDERTFQYDKDLLTLPVPDLSYTLKKYLASVHPLVTPEEYKKTEAVVQQFAQEEGKYLQQKLTEFAQGQRNWLDKWWEDTAYLEVRLPAPLMNMAGPGPYRDIWPAQTGTQIPRAAVALHYTLKFWEFTRKEMQKPMRDGKGRPMCMYQYKRIFNTVRVPGVHRDKLVHYFKTEREWNCPTHIVVMSKGHIFRLETMGDDGEILTPPEFEMQLQRIKDESIALGPAQGVPFLTSMERTAWAEARNRLVSLHPQNYQVLQTIEESVLAVWLEDGTPGDESHLANMSLLGSGENRWFDKSLSSGFYENGLVVSSADHTPAEGIMLVYITFYVHNKLHEIGGKWQGSKTIRPLPDPKHLQFELDSHLMQSIEKARKDYAEIRQIATAEVREYTKYGKNYCKQKRLHPDAMCQMAMQLAYYRLYKKMAPTYQTAPLKQFYHGRTETMRTCTDEAFAWCKAMDDPTVAQSKKFELFVNAINKHNKDFAEACELKACDRHLLGLYLISKEEGRPIPALFTDPSFVKSGGGGNYILSTSCIGYTSVLGAVLPMCENCIGCFYRINEDKLTFYVTTWNADVATSSSGYATECCNALDSMRELVDQQGPSANATKL